MTLAKAVEILDLFINQNKPVTNPDLEDAIKLGIEALKRYQEERARNADPMGRPLPSETSE